MTYTLSFSFPRPPHPFPSLPSLPASRMLTGSYSFGKLFCLPHSLPKVGAYFRSSDPRVSRFGRNPSNLAILHMRQFSSFPSRATHRVAELDPGPRLPDSCSAHRLPTFHREVDTCFCFYFILIFFEWTFYIDKS